jgi:hypothetical protein
MYADRVLGLVMKKKEKGIRKKEKGKMKKKIKIEAIRMILFGKCITHTTS